MTAQRSVRGDVAVLVPAAGLGTRLGPGAPKALREVAGSTLLTHAVRRLTRAPSVGYIVVAAPVGELTRVADGLAEFHAVPHLATRAEFHALRPHPTARDEYSGRGFERGGPESGGFQSGLQSGSLGTGDMRVHVVEGGPTRQHSVAAALAAVPAGYPVILVHDAARAFAPPELVERVAGAVRDGHEAVIPVLAVVDTIKQVDDAGYVTATPERAALRAVQTPQGFARALLERAHRAAVDGRAGPATDDAALVELLGARVFCVPGSDAALKITRPADLVTAELLATTEPATSAP